MHINLSELYYIPTHRYEKIKMNKSLMINRSAESSGQQALNIWDIKKMIKLIFKTFGYYKGDWTQYFQKSMRDSLLS